MNRIIAATALATSLLVAGLASAKTDTALFPSNNASAQVSFYSANSTGQPGGVPLTTVMVNNSPVAASIGGIEAATHVTVVHDGDPYTFALSESGNNKNDVWLVIPNGATAARYVADSGTISLGALMDGLSVNPALLEELQRDTPKG